MNAPSDAGSPPGDPVARVANRIALLTIGGLCCFLLALIATPLAFRESERTAVRIVASAPVPVGLGLAVAVRAARAQLRAERERAGATGSTVAGVASLGEAGLGEAAEPPHPASRRAAPHRERRARHG